MGILVPFRVFLAPVVGADRFTGGLRQEVKPFKWRYFANTNCQY